MNDAAAPEEGVKKGVKKGVTVYRIPSGDGQKTETVDVGSGGFWDSLAQTGDGAALPALVALAASASALALAAGSKEHEEE